MKLRVFFVRYGYEDYKYALQLLINHLQKIGICDLELLCIENNINSILEVPEINLSRNKIKVIYGDNSFGEFSAWDWAIKKTKIHNGDLFLFATSAYRKDYKGNDWCILEKISSRSLDFLYSNKCIMGEMNRAYENFSNLEGNFRYYLRSGLFLMNSQALKVLSPFNSFISGFESPDEIFNHVKASDNYKKFIRNWIGNQDFDGASWQKDQPIKELNSKEKILKIQSIINEHLLSQRAKKLNIQLIDIVTNLHQINLRDDKRQFEFRLSIYPDS
jgi:hypothetical protein